MKSRARELVDKSVASMIAAIEVYNKPDFRYREETFAILGINSWELLLKARWLAEHNNQMKSLYIFEERKRADGTPYRHPQVVTGACGNPKTLGWRYLARNMAGANQLPTAVLNNLVALGEIRDSSVHFYNRNGAFALQLQEVGSAAVKNYVKLAGDWFDVDLSQFSLYLMPLSFIAAPTNVSAVILNHEEQNLAAFIRDMATKAPQDAEFAVAVTVEVHFSRSKASDAVAVQLTSDPTATRIHLTEEQLKDKWPFTYETLTKECRKRYADFVCNDTYHAIRRSLKANPKFCYVRWLDPGNPKSVKQDRYSHAVFSELDKHYTAKR